MWFDLHAAAFVVYQDMLSEALLCFGASSTSIDEQDDCESSHEVPYMICYSFIYPVWNTMLRDIWSSRFFFFYGILTLFFFLFSDLLEEMLAKNSINSLHRHAHVWNMAQLIFDSENRAAMANPNFLVSNLA